MSYSLAVILFILMVISGILIRNRFTFEALIDLNLPEKGQKEKQLPLVSLCIPARNEEKNIERCLLSLLAQNYPNYEILVLDDCSEDKTGEIIQGFEKKYPDLIKSITGLPKPDDWLGKPWACHQLSQHSSGDYIIFADSDTWFEPETIKSAISRFEQNNLDFITVWPHQVLQTFWERTIIPMLYYVLLGFLITDYATDLPRCIPRSLHPLIAPLFAAANGQFIGFKRDTYFSINGHTCVKDNIVEDVELARCIRKLGFRMKMFHGMRTVHCRMYETHRKIKMGFQKNFLAGFNFNIPLFLLAAIFHFIIYILPFFTLIYGFYSGSVVIIILSLLTAFIPIAQRLLLARWFSLDYSYAFLHVLGVLWFEWLGIISIYQYVFKRPVFWKNRKL